MPKTNTYGEYIDCACRTETTFRRGKCSAFDGWYGGLYAQRDRCSGCPFYKSKMQMQREKVETLHRLSRIGLIEAVEARYPMAKKWLKGVRELAENLDSRKGK